MLQQAEEQLITITSEAAQAVQNILAEKKMQGHALRIYVSGSSCCGVQFGMALDDKVSATDTAFDAGALKIVVDERSLEYARGASIEYVNDPEKGQGFVINPPTHAERDSCCGGGGGGSCSCNN